MANLFQIGQDLKDLLEGLSFRNNPNLRPQGAEIAYTQEMIDEWIKCSNDPIHFMRNYVHVVHLDRGVVKMEPYPFQERVINAYHDHRRVVVLTPRQYGKCCGINSHISIRNKETNQIVNMTIGDFYAWQKLRKELTDEVVQKLRNNLFINTSE